MKFSMTVVLALAAASTSSAFCPQQGHGGRALSVPAFAPRTLGFTTDTRTRIFQSTEAAATDETKKKLRKKDERLRMMKSDRFFRKGFKEVRGQVEDMMQEQFKSPIVDDLTKNDFIMQREGVKVHLAKVRQGDS
jgi:hypothetical protein